MASEIQLLRENLLSQEQSLEGGLRLERFTSSLKRHLRLIVGITVITTSAAAVRSVSEMPVYQSEFELSTPLVTLENQIISDINPDALSNQVDRLETGLLDETKLKILTSPRVMEPVVETLKKQHPDITYTEVVKSLTVVSNQTGEILTVQYQNEDKQKVTNVLETVAAAYLKYSLRDRQNEVDRGVDFVDEQLPAVRARVSDLETELENLRQGFNLIDPSLQGRQLSEQVAAFKSEQLDLRVQIQQTYEIYADLQEELARGEELATTSVLLASDRYQALLDQLLAIDSQLADELTLYLEGSPEIAVTREQRDNLLPLLEQEGVRVQTQVASYIRELEAREQALQASIVILNEEISNLSTITRQYNSIQRDLGIASDNLNQFLTKREALRIDAAQRRTPWEILTMPAPPKAAASNATLTLTLGALLGLLLGAGLSILIERLDNKIHTVNDLRETALAPILGRIPYSRQIENSSARLGNGQNAFLPYVVEQDFQPFLESFTRLATNIQLNNPDNPIKAITVSSAMPNVGKSTVSYHLAQASAAMGQRTLLVDTDLRRPSLHQFGGIANENGLSNYISGKAELADIIVAMPNDNNLFLVPSGSLPPDPTRILSAKRMETFCQSVYAEFDMVIFDTPPLLGFADSFMVARRTQGILLTTRLNQVKFSHLTSAFEEMQTANVSVVGMVANCSRQEQAAYDMYKHYYESTGHGSSIERRGSKPVNTFDAIR